MFICANCVFLRRRDDGRPISIFRAVPVFSLVASFSMTRDKHVVFCIRRDDNRLDAWHRFSNMFIVIVRFIYLNYGVSLRRHDDWRQFSDLILSGISRFTYVKFCILWQYRFSDDELIM